MKITKFLLLATLAGFVALPSAPAQPSAASVPSPAPSVPTTPAATSPHGPKSFHHAWQARVLRSLHLTPDQKIQARAIHRQTAAAVKAISDNPALTPDQKLAQIRATRQRGHRQFRELLTDQQREKLYRLQKLIVRFRRLTQE